MEGKGAMADGNAGATRLAGAARARLAGIEVIDSASALAHYAQSEGHHGGHTPALALRARSVADVQAIVTFAGETGAALVPWGAGSSLEGNAAADAGTILLDLTAMDAVLEIAPEDMLCVVEPGVTREALNADLRATGLFFPVDPGANATIGGMLSTRASGTTSVRYGTMRDQALALKVVLPDGRLIRTGTRARKSAAGYDLTHLFVGSEGTLGVIVEATLRLHPQPEAIASAVFSFPTVAAAVETVTALVQVGAPVARLELLDPAAIAACNAFAGLTLAEAPTLFVELHAAEAAVADQLALVQDYAEASGGSLTATATAPEDRARLWKARHAALPAARALRPGCVAWVTDVCVPISALAPTIALAQSAIAHEGMIAPILGHVGDGNFHVFFILDPDAPAEWAAAARVNEIMIEAALAAGGTCTGEHGIGLGKRAALVREAGADAVDAMRAIKAALDPQNLMNPGKVI
jgi:D-lactate dehydrogenase (cytochrome)